MVACMASDARSKLCDALRRNTTRLGASGWSAKSPGFTGLFADGETQTRTGDTTIFSPALWWTKGESVVETHDCTT